MQYTQLYWLNTNTKWSLYNCWCVISHFHKKYTFNQHHVWVMLSFTKRPERLEDLVAECFDWTNKESPDDGVPPSDQVQRGTAVTPAPLGFGKKSAAAPLLATETWQSLSMPKIKSKDGEEGRDRNRSLVQAFLSSFSYFFLIWGRVLLSVHVFIWLLNIHAVTNTHMQELHSTASFFSRWPRYWGSSALIKGMLMVLVKGGGSVTHSLSPALCFQLICPFQSQPSGHHVSFLLYSTLYLPALPCCHSYSITSPLIFL